MSTEILSAKGATTTPIKVLGRESAQILCTSGSFNGSAYLQIQANGREWVNQRQIVDTIQFTTDGPGVYRVQIVEYTSGTLTVSQELNDDILFSVRRENGDTPFYVTRLGPSFPPTSDDSDAGMVPRPIREKLLETVSVKDFGAVGDGVTDDTAALIAAFASGLRLFVPEGNYRVTAAINLPSGAYLHGAGRDKTRIFLDTASPNVSLFTGASVVGAVIRDITIDGGLNGTHTQGNAIALSAASSYCVVENVHIQNSPRESILIRDASHHNVVRNCTFDRQGGGSGHVYFLTDCTDNEVVGNHFNDSAGGCIWLSGRILRTKIIGNSCDQSDYELIGVRWDCGYGEIIGNTALLCGDNGISVTGYGFTVTGNTCIGNDFAGIGIYGSRNTVSANVCVDNGVAGGSAHPGILLAANFGGLAADNLVAGNDIQRIAGASTDQYYGIRVSSTAYTAWGTGVAVSVDTFRTNANKLYVSTTAGTTGATAPTHTSGTASDGGVTWLYVGTFQNTNARPAGNRIGLNKILNHAGGNIQRFGASPQNFDEEDEYSKYMRVQTAWATGVAKTIGSIVYNVLSDGVPAVYRATNAGTTGATPPTHTSGSASDGAVTWYFLGRGYYNQTRVETESGTLFKTPIQIESLDSTASPPTILAGTFAPEGVVTAANGSLYLRSNSTDNIAVYLKTGTTNTANGWQLLATRLGGTTANRPASPQPYMMYFDTTLGKPVWRNGGNTAWVDATGAVV